MASIFGLPETATPEEVKQRWRELCMTHHPDHGGAAEDFQALHREYRRLMEIAEAPRSCRCCGGTGKNKVGSGFSYIDLECPECGGTGKE